MSYITSSSATIHASLTRLGRQLLASNQKTFNVTQFGVSDDEINYNLLGTDGIANVDQDSPSITGLPITESSSNENNAIDKLIFVNQTYLGQSFPNQTQSAQYITALISTGGGTVILHSDDTATQVN
ncbi:MAG: hypothetical protein ACREQ5_28295, partial [Candidatus Dormibacteria bacterium]